MDNEEQAYFAYWDEQADDYNVWEENQISLDDESDGYEDF